ncbi:MAG: hypothetical protein IKZ37_09370 [Bacteroidaceae bacterium]|nr:hypothetical protein [Bacteroidaceae bacterium]
MNHKYTHATKQENRHSLFYILMFVPYIVTILSHIFIDKVRYATNTWYVTEVLINYQGGFVRRGLIGEIIYQLHNSGIDALFSVYFFSIVSAIIFFYLIIRDTIRKQHSIWLLPTVMLLSSLFVSGHWVRKDFFIMLLFYAIVKLLQQKGIYKYIYINLLLVIGILTHEVIIFISTPILFISLLSKENKTPLAYIKTILKEAIYYSPALIASILVFTYKGNTLCAIDIWNSWTKAGVVNSEMKGAIAAIGWSMEKAIEVGTEVWSTIRCGVYYPIMWSLLALSGFIIYMWMYKIKQPILGYKPNKEFDIKESAYIIILQFLAMVPLLIVFADTSRAFFYVIMSAYIIRLYDDKMLYINTLGKLPNFICSILDSIDTFINKHTKGFAIFAFIIGLPSISISALEHIILHGQIGFLIKSFIEIFK